MKIFIAVVAARAAGFLLGGAGARQGRARSTVLFCAEK